ncbi:MAG: ACT domain-containing protein [Chitinivibrionales bacterium]|nr:ACT domain-containing protein [Chitinivibrionales bacterium]MBD3356335.1 ACT domain-containing protein [Chitinivibrionales bacterium]
MDKVATLGPSNTFSALAAERYTHEAGRDYSIALFPTMGKAIGAVGKGCRCAVVPIENMAEGYVSIVLDLLIRNNLSIIHELLLPIQFSFAANCDSLQAVDKVYAQFVAQGQCEQFLDSLHDVPVITTQSNGASCEQLCKGVSNEGAIVPAFAVKFGAFPLVVEDIADRDNNCTRFIAVAAEPQPYDPSLRYKTTLLIVESVDRPGMLADILAGFAKRNINLVSIMSRPTKEMMGRYHFFIDVEGHCREARIAEVLDELRRENTIRVLGSYPKAQSPS